MSPIIYLRPWKMQDAGELAAIANNKKIWQNVRDHFPHPYTVKHALDWIEYCGKQNPVENLAIIYNNHVAGSIGVIPQKDVYRMCIELGYFIGEPFWGKGIATEAVRLGLEYIRENFSVIRVYAEVFETNTTSMQVLKKNGFHLEAVRERSVIKNNVIMNDHVWVKFLE